MAKNKDIKNAWQKLCEIVPTKKAYWIKWYCSDKEDREKFEIFSKKNLNGITEETANDYILEEEVQNGIRYWMGLMNVKHILDVYNKMYEKSLTGDVQASKFIIEFSKSDFFNKNENELANFLNQE